MGTVVTHEGGSIPARPNAVRRSYRLRESKDESLSSSEPVVGRAWLQASLLARLPPPQRPRVPRL